MDFELRIDQSGEKFKMHIFKHLEKSAMFCQILGPMFKGILQHVPNSFKTNYDHTLIVSYEGSLKSIRAFHNSTWARRSMPSKLAFCNCLLQGRILCICSILQICEIKTYAILLETWVSHIQARISNPPALWVIGSTFGYMTPKMLRLAKIFKLNPKHLRNTWRWQELMQCYPIESRMNQGSEDLSLHC